VVYCPAPPGYFGPSHATTTATTSHYQPGRLPLPTADSAVVGWLLLIAGVGCCQRADGRWKLLLAGCYLLAYLRANSSSSIGHGHFHMN